MAQPGTPDASVKAGNPAQSPTGAGRAMRGEEVNTQVIREKITRTEKRLKHIVDNINKALDNFNNKPYVALRLSDIIREHRQLLNEYKAMEEIKDPDIVARLYAIRDKLEFIDMYIDGIPDALKDYPGTVEILLIDLKKQVNYMLGQLDILKGLLEELAGYDDKLDHTEQQGGQHHSTAGNQHQLFLHL